MKKQLKKAISLNKLTIARIQTNKMNQLNGGDCLPTTHCHEGEDGWSEWYCGHTVNIP